MAVGDGRDDQLVGAGDPLQRLQPVGDLVGVTDELRCGAVLYHRQLLLRQRLDFVGIRVGTAPSPARIEYTQWP